ncbi:MAG: hypothetical protein VB013_12950 [Anaerolineaceae bacterium]|jgi:hypothetical protein|nr:hypothetical protein [Anaerolineaceae bacterium]
MKTPNKRIALIILSLVIVITLFFAGRFIPTLAKAIYPDMYGLVEKNEPKLINDLSTQEEVKTESTDESFPSINDEVITPVTPDAKSQLSTMLSELGNITFSKSGWIHFVYSNESDISNGVILPDGNLMPQNYINDGWYFVNDQGFVIKHLISLVDDAGNVLQREIFVNDTLVNLTTNEKMENIQPYRLKLDLGFSQEMLAMQDGGAILGEETDEIEGKPVIKFSIQGTFDKPTVLSNGSQPVKSIKLLMIFDQQNGAINEAEKIWQLTDDTEVLFEKNQVLTLQSDELPNEIAQILECGK